MGTGGVFFQFWSQVGNDELFSSIPIIDGNTSVSSLYRVNPRPSINTEMSTKSVDVDQDCLSPPKRINQVQGNTALFWVLNIGTMNHYLINATLEVTGPHCLIYSNLSTITESTLLMMNDSFESIIYPRLSEFFGLPPDIDSNKKVILLVYDILDGLGGGTYVSGFFYPLNQYLNSDLPPNQRYSNEAEIIHIDGVEGLSHLIAGEFATLAHEFQHMIHFGRDDDEDLWLDEGASMFAEFLIGEDPFIDGPYKPQFSSNAETSLTYWDYYNNQGLVLANYGAAFAFFLYLAEHYGGSTIIQTLVNCPENGIISIEEALGFLSFREIFRNWTIANFLDDTSFADGLYGYYNISLSMSVEESYNTVSVIRTENSVPYWGTDYLKFTNRMNLPFNFEFKGDITSDFIVTAILSNTTTPPFNSKVIPINISSTEFGTFSIDPFGSVDEIIIVISAYTQPGNNDHNNEEPAPSQAYWFLVNPSTITIVTGNLTFLENGDFLRIWNVTVFDENGLLWQDADGAIYDIQTELGVSTGITGNLTFNFETNTWETTNILISALPEGCYRVLYHFFNESCSGFVYSELFTITTVSSNSTFSSNPQSTFISLSSTSEESLYSSRDTFETSQQSSVKVNPSINFLLIIIVLTMSPLIVNRRRKSL